MRSRFLAVTFALLCVPVLATAQEVTDRQLVVPLADGGFVAFRSETAKAGTKDIFADIQEPQGEFRSQALADDNHVVHRVLADTAGKYLFGYDLVVTPNPGLKIFKIAVKPLDSQFESRLRVRSSDASDSKIATLPRATAPQVLEDGDAFTLDLLINLRTGMKIVDVVRVSFDRSRLWDINPAKMPRDFTLDAVELAVKEYKLRINGNAVAAGKPDSNFVGALIWFYVEGHGRFIFSLFPREGYQFQKIGTIADNKIEFTLKGERYEWLSSSPILRNGGTWNLWVLHDPKYLPLGSKPAARSEMNKLDELDASIKAAEQKIRRPGSPKSSTFRKTEADSGQGPKRLRVIVGGADRIENLWPKQ
ncbi:MAG: hypothetical protein ACREBG_19690 [Pyrinomonadaceae bacterium]